MNEWMNEYMTFATQVELSQWHDVFRAFWPISAIKKTRDLRTNGRMDERTDGRTDGRTDQRMDGQTNSWMEKLSYRDA